MTAETQPLPHGAVDDSLLTNPKIRGIVVQVLLIAAIVAFSWWIIDNTRTNLQQAKIASGFGFLQSRSGFDIAQKPIAFTSDSTYGRAIVVGLLNTLIIAGTGIVMATVLGFLVGVGRLSRNFLIRGLSTVYVETFRNIPPLLVIVFWYVGVLSVLHGPRGVEPSPVGIYLTNRGLQMPAASFSADAWLIPIAFLIGLCRSSRS